jgi:signal transduction histidine kinase
MNSIFSWLRLTIYTRKYFFYCCLTIAGVLLQFLFPQICFSQRGQNQISENKFRTFHWGVEDGLSQGEVYDMIKDEHGFLWIGTPHGLNRFDGSSFKKYFAGTSKSNKTIAGNAIGGLIEDSTHNIWIGTDKGLSYYDILMDTFRNIFSDAGKRSTGTLIIPFWATRDEVFCWDYPESQLAAYNIHSFVKRSLVKITPNDSVGYGLSDHYPIFDAGSGSIWLEKGGPQWPGGGLLQIFLNTKKRVDFTWPCFRKIPNHSHAFEGMRYDPVRHSIWISSQDGLVEFTLNDKKFRHVDAINKFQKSKNFSFWAGIDIDAQGKIWQGTFPKGIIIYDPVSQSVKQPFPGDSVLQQNISNSNVLIFCDRDGITWTGSWSVLGINQIIPFSPAVKHYVADLKHSNSLNTDYVFGCIDAGNNKIWISSDKGINIFDAGNDLFEVIRRKDLTGIKGEHQTIGVIGVDTIKKKAFIQADDIFQLDIPSKQCIPVRFIDSTNQKNTNSAGGLTYRIPIPYQKSFIISSGLGDQEKQGIYILDPDSPVAKQILSFPANTIDIFRTATDDHFIFLKRNDSEINLTYSLRNGKWIRFPTSLDSIPWKRIIYNSADKTYWLSTEKALYHYDKEIKQIRIYNSQDGLPDLEIYGMINDDLDNLWFNTESSINLLDIKSDRITTLSDKDGFRKQVFTSMLNIEKSSTGELYLPGGMYGTGFNSINPKMYIKTASYVYLQSLTLNQIPASIQKNINNLSEINLSDFENNITIETGILDFYSKGNSHIRYKLGEKSDWLYPVNSSRYTIHYEGLAPGNYKLIMQASNSSNEFVGPEKTLFINISPPWWQTWWARSVFILALAFSLWGFIQYRSRNLKQRNVMLEEKVMHRTKELKHSLENLRDTQAQLIQREKMASLGELTAGIAHEIQNPLNFVNNFSEVNVELIEELKELQIQESRNFKSETELLDNIKDNEQKISHHGKRADAIVKGMLQHSRISSGLKELANINELADEYLRLSYHGLRAKEKSFNATLNEELDQSIEQIRIIPQDIGRVFLNLFNNAFYSIYEKKKEMGEGFDPTVFLVTRQLENKVMITIRDNGRGISHKIIDKIYNPFFTTKPPGEGTGLGLSLSYDIITKIHDGELIVESVEGEFAEFTIILPK